MSQKIPARTRTLVSFCPYLKWLGCWYRYTSLLPACVMCFLRSKRPAAFVSHSIYELDTWKSWGTMCRLVSGFAACRNAAGATVWVKFCSSSHLSSHESTRKHSALSLDALVSSHSRLRRTSASSYRVAVYWLQQADLCSWPSCLLSFSCSACSETCGISVKFW